ncbi:hypothetical protein AAG570_000298 [Ranatra chinensis]|uniref:Dynein axonemal assembly factor 10 n=1 Tax=Ranatra chinensis TaxID=642074 RepID=A0ABD0YWN3_9HEMI
MDKPQIICHVEKPVPYSLFDGLWIPCSAKFVVMGSRPNNNGIIQIYQVSSPDVVLLKEVEKDIAFKCGTFGASSLRQRQLATGNFQGQLEIWDIENMYTPVYSVDAHTEIINCIDGIAGQSLGCGAPEIVTGSRDGSVKLWDPRQKGCPVAVMEPIQDGNQLRRDCWCVTFGNSFNNEERMICAGYDNGDIKMFDLKNLSVRWETNIKNGVCSIEFDRKDIDMNKMVATSLESKFYVYDLRTQHSKKGFASLSEKAHKSTIWTVRHAPQNRDLFVTCGGNGSICLWKYEYPLKRVKDDLEGEKVGVMGNVQLLQNSTLTSQPISSFAWCPDKLGLGLATSFDQAFRLVIITKLKLY